MPSTAPGVTVGNAAKIAAELTEFALTNNIDPAQVIPLFEQTLDGVLATMATRTEDTAAPAGSNTFSAEQSIQSAFPGTTVVPNEPQQVAPIPDTAPANVVPPTPTAVATTPAAIPGVQADPTEEAWNVFFASVENGTFAADWEDNRAVKQQGGKFAKIPDFKHKSWQRPGDKYPVGVYIDDKKNPNWVAGKLAAIGIS